MKFRRKSDRPGDPAPGSTAGSGAEGTDSADSTGGTDGSSADGQQAAAAGATPDGPHDYDDLAPALRNAEQPGWIDLGSLLLTPVAGTQLRMQVDEASQKVQAVLLAGPEGALEVMAFAAPRGGGLWDEVRPQIAADMARRGGTATEREGRWGTELDCRIQVQRGDGTPATQPSRIIGIDGPRWMLRASLLGRPALDEDVARRWEDVLGKVVVRRGSEPMPVGDQLPIVLPPEARPVS